MPGWRSILAALLCLLPGSIAAQQPNVKRVLLLFAEYKQRDQFLEAFEASVNAQVKADIAFEESYLEGPEGEGQNPGSQTNAYLEGAADSLRRRFKGVKLDLVVVVGPWALDLASQYHDKMLPGVPVVYCCVSEWQFAGRTLKGVTGVTTHIGLGETIDLAMRLNPDTQEVVVISPYDPPWLAATRNELNRYQGKVKQEYFVGPPSRQLFEKVVALPPHTIVLFQLSLQQSGRPPFEGFDLLDAVAQRVPTYSSWSNLCLNHGCIGGVYGDNSDMIQLTASEAARVLSGEPIDKIPVEHVTGLRTTVDWRALQHWHIPESALPASSVILYREPSLWEQGKKYFLAGIAVIVVQSLLISALFWQRARRRKAEIELARSEQKFSKAFHRSPLAITLVTVKDDRYIDVNEAFEIHTGWKRDEVIGRSPLEINLWVDSGQRAAFMRQLADQGNVRDLETPFRRKDGHSRIGLGSAELIDIHGEPCALSVIADITDRKEAEQAIAGISGKLIEAQETERTRIARELHDDINQRLAMVAISLKTARKCLPESPEKAGRILVETGEQVSKLEDDVQALSHRLHSSKLEYLGLEAAAAGFCRELSEGHGVKIDLHCEAIPEELSSEVSLCLFRVLQEALHNALKYSGVEHFEVSLIGAPDGIELRVHDSGAGFDPKRAGNGSGLGLTSMKERLRLVDGELSIDSMPGQGTTVLARVATKRMAAEAIHSMSRDS